MQQLGVILIWLGAFAFLAWYFAKSLGVIPKMHIGIPEVFGKRWKIVLQEGWCFRPYWIMEISAYSLENRVRKFKVKVKSKDGITLNLDSAYEYIPDKTNALVFMENEKGLIDGAVDNSIMNELGIIAGVENAESFITQREAIVLFINCLLRLVKMPHLKEKIPVPTEEILKFYRNNTKKIRQLLTQEDKKVNEKSLIERKYGIDVTVFDLMVPDFEESYSKVLQKKKEADALVEAAKRELSLAKDFEGVSEKGINAAQVSLGKAERKVFSIEGKPIEINLGRINPGGEK